MLGKTNLLFVAEDEAAELAFKPEYILTSSSGNMLKIEYINNLFFVFTDKNEVLYGSDVNSLQLVKKDGAAFGAKNIVYTDNEYYLTDAKTYSKKAVIYKTSNFTSYEEVILKTFEEDVKVAGLFISSENKIVAFVERKVFSGGSNYHYYYDLLITDSLSNYLEENLTCIEVGFNVYNSPVSYVSMKKDRIFISYERNSKIITLNGTYTDITSLYDWFISDYFFYYGGNTNTAGQPLYYSLNGVDYIRLDFDHVKNFLPLNIFGYDGNIAMIYSCEEGDKTVQKFTTSATPKGLTTAINSAIPVSIEYTMHPDSNLYEDGYSYMGCSGGIIIKGQIENSEVERPDVVVIKGLAAKEALKQANDYTDEKYKNITKEVELYEETTKQYMQNAFWATPEGYAELVDTVSENKVKVDAIIEKADLRIKVDASGEEIHMTDSADAKVVEFALYGKSTQNGTPTPDAPVEIETSGRRGSVVVKSCGKNYFKLSEITTLSSKMKTEIKDESIRIYNEEATTHSSVKKLIDFSQMKVGRTYTISVDILFKSGVGCIALRSISGNIIQKRSDFITANGKYSFTFELPNEDCYISLFSTYSTSEIGDITYSNIQVEEGAEATEYEPYKETSATILTVPDFGGIPVQSGGNYTDQNGQQWICDEIVKNVDGTGEYIQRIKPFTLTGNEEWKVDSASGYFYTSKILTNGRKSVSPLLSNLYPYSLVANANLPDKVIKHTKSTNDVPLLYLKDSSYSDLTALKAGLSQKNVNGYYILHEPIHTPLTAEQIAEIERLSTFYPETNIFNDVGCGMSVKYHADSKNYIDRMVAEQVASIVASMK